MSAEPASGVLDPLHVVAGKIKVLLTKSENQRISAGWLLAEAKRRVEAGEAGEIDWQSWCHKNIERSQRDIRRLIALVESDDPEAAVAAYREQARAGRAKRRERTNVSPPEALPVQTALTLDAVILWFTSLDAAARRECLKALDKIGAEPAEAAVEPNSVEKVELPRQLADTNAAPPESGTELAADDGGLFDLWAGLKCNTRYRALKWVEDGHPVQIDPTEHPIITEALVPFRAAAGTVMGEQLDAFVRRARGASP